MANERKGKSIGARWAWVKIGLFYIFLAGLVASVAAALGAHISLNDAFTNPNWFPFGARPDIPTHSEPMLGTTFQLIFAGALIIAGILALVGFALCLAAPFESRARAPMAYAILAGGAAVFIGLAGAFFVGRQPHSYDHVLWMNIIFGPPAAIASTLSEVLFLLFLARILRHFARTDLVKAVWFAIIGAIAYGLLQALYILGVYYDEFVLEGADLPEWTLNDTRYIFKGYSVLLAGLGLVLLLYTLFLVFLAYMAIARGKKTAHAANSPSHALPAS